MKGGDVFKPGPAHTNGSRVFHRPGPATKAEIATGKAGGKALGPPLPAWMGDPARRCKDKPTRWWYAPERADDDNGGLSATERVATKADATRATGLCKACPRQLDCALWGLRHERWGIWGGIQLTGLHAATRRQQLDRVLRLLQQRRPA